MELQNPFSNIIFMLSFLILLVLFKIVQRWSFNNSTTKLPPGPWKLPLIGNIHQISGSSPPHHLFKKLAEKYGPLMHLKLGEVPYVVVSSPEMAKEIMKTHDITFCDRPNVLLPRVFTYNARDIAFSTYGELWRQLRKICVVELLSAKRVQSFSFIREEEVSDLVKSISANEGSIVNLSKSIFSMTYGIVARSAFGKKNRHQQLFKSTIEEALGLLGEFCIADLYPSIKILQKVSRVKTRVERLQGEIDRILQDIINDHRNNHSKTSKDEDLVDVLLKVQHENVHSQQPLTDENIKSVIQDLFIAGSETSSGIVLWAMSEMIKNPIVMEEAQVEVRRVFDKKGYVDETELQQLTYLKCVIKETFRLHPTVPLLVPRESRERCEINGYEIPAKTRVAVNVWAIGRDPKYWVEAESFKPERFVNSSIDFKGTDFELIPFGAGRRMCPGIAFALPNVELPLAKLLYHFDWKLPNGMSHQELDMTESFGLTVGKKHDVCLIPITRRP
ncbi:putative premnaspirodiene oxygenase [Medicago truncatula]|uniref:Cytochrome P450 family 71 protein n=1 Tax=Medicago truncatula TaxID=3880 RepID=G7K4E9_MEDTR|nr:cytochrome P450 71D10 isoform X1 [Medicago truncatula]AET00665.1 cytochrome P450 family 71 protein [Medicago truncatula]RHN57909.1 putative premnaspirodiene oxygenase [Medicago truncatula]